MNLQSIVDKKHQPSQEAAQSRVAVAPASHSSRMMSIDVMRGITVAFMIMVNNNGQNTLAYPWMNHSIWNGFTAADLVFPVFLFIVGISLVLARSSRSLQQAPRSALLRRIARRTCLLLLLGLLVNGFPYFHLGTLRIYGVLQRIAICYCLASLLLLATRKIYHWFFLFVFCLVLYWVLLCVIPVPGHGLPGSDIPLLDRDLNLTAYVDRLIFPHRLFEISRDPEGLLSSIPSFTTTLLGMLAGRWLIASRSASTKLSGMLVCGQLLLAAGLLWSQTFPINKKLWTSSYVLYAGGWSVLILAVFYAILDIKRWHKGWTSPWLALGVNAIFAYVYSELLSSAVSAIHVNAQQSVQQFLFQDIFQYIQSPAFGSLVYSILFAIICWIPTWLLYRRGIVIKV